MRRRTVLWNFCMGGICSERNIRHCASNLEKEILTYRKLHEKSVRRAR